MGKKIVIERLKEELVAKVQRLDEENYETKLDEIESIVKAIRFLYPIPFEQSVGKGEDGQRAAESPSGTDSMVGKVFRFERKLRGGFIPCLDGGYFIPEKMVRDMGVNDGDLLKIVAEHPGADQTYYTFEIVEKNDSENLNRVEHRYCKVEKDGNLLVVKESLGEAIRIGELPMTFVLKEKDVQLFRLEEGDIVDIAYYRNSPTETVKVVYKHETDIVAERTIEQRKKEFQCSHEDDKCTKQGRIVHFPVDLQLFADKKILIIGGMSRHNDYKKAFEELGVEFEALSGDEDGKRLEAAIKRNDIIVLVLGELSHAASTMAVRMCKTYDKPFDYTHSNGIQSVLLSAENAIHKGMENGTLPVARESA